MSSNEFRMFLNAAILLCALAAIINIFRQKSRGVSALILSTAFLAMGGLLYLVQQQASQSLLIAAGSVVFLLLTADLAVRSRAAEAKSRGEK